MGTFVPKEPSTFVACDVVTFGHIINADVLNRLIRRIDGAGIDNAGARVSTHWLY